MGEGLSSSLLRLCLIKNGPVRAMVLDATRCERILCIKVGKWFTKTICGTVQPPSPTKLTCVRSYCNDEFSRSFKDEKLDPLKRAFFNTALVLDWRPRQSVVVGVGLLVFNLPIELL